MYNPLIYSYTVQTNVGSHRTNSNHSYSLTLHGTLHKGSQQVAFHVIGYPKITGSVATFQGSFWNLVAQVFKIREFAKIVLWNLCLGICWCNLVAILGGSHWEKLQKWLAALVMFPANHQSEIPYSLIFVKKLHSIPVFSLDVLSSKQIVLLCEMRGIDVKCWL